MRFKLSSCPLPTHQVESEVDLNGVSKLGNSFPSLSQVLWRIQHRLSRFGPETKSFEGAKLMDPEKNPSEILIKEGGPRKIFVSNSGPKEMDQSFAHAAWGSICRKIVVTN